MGILWVIMEIGENEAVVDIQQFLLELLLLLLESRHVSALWPGVVVFKGNVSLGRGLWGFPVRVLALNNTWVFSLDSGGLELHLQVLSEPFRNSAVRGLDELAGLGCFEGSLGVDERVQIVERLGSVQRTSEHWMQKRWRGSKLERWSEFNTGISVGFKGMINRSFEWKRKLNEIGVTLNDHLRFSRETCETGKEALLWGWIRQSMGS